MQSSSIVHSCSDSLFSPSLKFKFYLSLNIILFLNSDFIINYMSSFDFIPIVSYSNHDASLLYPASFRIDKELQYIDMFITIIRASSTWFDMIKTLWRTFDDNFTFHGCFFVKKTSTHLNEVLHWMFVTKYKNIFKRKLINRPLTNIKINNRRCNYIFF